jgi:hypothetical protein
MPATPVETRIKIWQRVLDLHLDGVSAGDIAHHLSLGKDNATRYLNAIRAADDPKVFVADKIASLQLKAQPAQTLDGEVKQARADAERRFEKSVYKQLLGEKARTQQIIEAIEAVIPKLPHAEVRVLAAPVSDSKPQTCLLLFSDLHIGSVIREQDTGGMGRYDYPTFKRRLNSLRDSVRSIAHHHRQSHPVRKLVIAALGDNVEGETIFPSQRLGIDMDVLTQSFKAVEDIAEFLVSLLDTFETIEFCGVVGNHGRIGRKGDTKTYVNWDHVIYRALAYKFEGTDWEKRISFEIPESFWIDKTIEGHSFMFRHGDGIKGWAGIPWYGITRSVSRWIALANARDKRFEYMAMGHFHQKAEIEIPAGEVFVNGSFVGASEFSVEVMEQISAATQLLLMVHPKYGVAARYPVVLDR